MKKNLQELFFPDGLIYNRENDCYRTHNVNVILDLLSTITSHYDENKAGQIESISDVSGSVDRRRRIFNLFFSHLAKFQVLI